MVLVNVLLLLFGISLLLGGLGKRKAAVSVALAPISILISAAAFALLITNLDLGAGYGAGAGFVLLLFVGTPILLFLVGNIALWKLGHSIPTRTGKSWVMLGLSGACILFAIAIFIVPSFIDSRNDGIYSDLRTISDEELIQLVLNPLPFALPSQRMSAILQLEQRGENAVPRIIEILREEFVQIQEDPGDIPEGIHGLINALGRIADHAALEELRRWVASDVELSCALSAAASLSRADDYSSIPLIESLRTHAGGDDDIQNQLTDYIKHLEEVQQAE